MNYLRTHKKSVWTASTKHIYFCILQATITIQTKLDREDPLLTKDNGVGKYTLLIEAKDKGVPSLSASATVSFIIYVYCVLYFILYIMIKLFIIMFMYILKIIYH